MERKNIKFYILGFLFIVASLVLTAVFSTERGGVLTVNFFDVGQGDAIFIEFWDSQILIDGGPDKKILEKLSKEMPFWDRTIDAVILTHPDPDHLNGILEVLKRYKVNKFFYSGEVLDYLKNNGINIVEDNKAEKIKAQAGQQIIFGKEGKIDILYPFFDFLQKGSDFNKSSVVCRLVFGKTSFLLTGDAPKSIEHELLAKQSMIKSDVLKIAHHGSNTSMDEYFFKEVFPKTAVISVGKDNKFGHPHGEVLNLLSKNAVKILRTDEAGDIKIISDGDKYWLENK